MARSLIYLIICWGSVYSLELVKGHTLFERVLSVFSQANQWTCATCPSPIVPALPQLHPSRLEDVPFLVKWQLHRSVYPCTSYLFLECHRSLVSIVRWYTIHTSVFTSQHLCAFALSFICHCDYISRVSSSSESFRIQLWFPEIQILYYHRTPRYLQSSRPNILWIIFLYYYFLTNFQENQCSLWVPGQLLHSRFFFKRLWQQLLLSWFLQQRKKVLLMFYRVSLNSPFWIINATFIS